MRISIKERFWDLRLAWRFGELSRISSVSGCSACPRASSSKAVSIDSSSPFTGRVEPSRAVKQDHAASGRCGRDVVLLHPGTGRIPQLGCLSHAAGLYSPGSCRRWGNSIISVESNCFSKYFAKYIQTDINSTQAGAHGSFTVRPSVRTWCDCWCQTGRPIRLRNSRFPGIFTVYRG